MQTNSLNTAEMTEKLTSYHTLLNSALSQSNHTKEDIEFLKNLIENVSVLDVAMQVQPLSNKLSWQIMTFISGAPQLLNSIKTRALRDDLTKNMHENMFSFCEILSVNHAFATQNLKKHINRNNNIEIISEILALISFILSALIAPWSAWGVSCLIPLYSTLALPLFVVLCVSIGMAITSRLHSSTLKEMYNMHNNNQDDTSNIKPKSNFFQTKDSDTFARLDKLCVGIGQ